MKSYIALQLKVRVNCKSVKHQKERDREGNELFIDTKDEKNSTVFFILLGFYFEK